jgi:hypothetical protein
MDLTFRLPGPWGPGKGSNLQPTEVDQNFWALAEAIVDLQSNPAQPVGITSISVSGTQMTITLTDGTVMGPFTLPVLTFRWRGEYEAGASYAELDVFTVTTGNPWIADTSTVRYGIFLVQVSIPAAPMFDPDLQIDGAPAFLQLFGSVDTLLSTLADVAVDEPPGFNPLAEGHVLRWTFDTNKWVNSYLGSMAVQDANNVHITGGNVTGLPAPLQPGDAATKAYVDALPAGMMVDDATMMANISGLTGPALANTLSDFLDYVLTTARGTLLYRGATGWVALPPGTSGQFLKTQGAGADPLWAPGGSGVTSITAGAGIDTTPDTIVASGSVALAAIADKTLLANASGASAAPSATTLTLFLDGVLGNTRGSVLVRAGSGWVALAPGTAGYFLQTQGSSADPLWASPAGAGTVTSISAGTGISTGGAPITGAGTVSLAAIATSSVLANISGGSAAPVPATVTALFDAVFGATQGAVLYRNASQWVVLAPGTSGQVLTTGGAAANPAWANAAAGAPIANLLLLANISGSTAAPSGNTLSNIFDAILGSSRGMLVYRGASGWVALSPGTSGQVLTTGGAAGDPHWAASAAGASISVSDTPPSSPSPGDAWFDGVGAQLYIRVDDGTSVQWVPASNQPGAQGPAGSANMSGMVAGQIPLAATATSVTSSIPLPLAVTRGGTGATTAPAALAALGGISGNQTITLSGAISGSGATAITTTLATVPIGSGGTNATTAAAALTNLGAVAKAGDTMTGTLTLQANLVLRKATTADANNIYGNGNDGQPRWVLALGDNVAESGGNVGTDFNLHRFTDTGAYIGSALQINRTTGDLTITGSVATKPGGGPWVAPSDRSLKSAATPWHTGLAEVLQLEPIIYRYNNAAWNLEDTDYVGVDAEDAAAVIPEMGRIVSVPADDVVIVDPQAPPGGVPPGHQTVEVAGIESGPLLFALVNAVKELSARLDKLEQPGVVQ